MNWLLFLPQIPASPSTLRVTIWRRMRAAGAYGLQNGVWILPSTPENRQFTEAQTAYIQQQGATSYSFDVTSLTPSVEATIVSGFRAQRDEEYIEFCERCDALLAELTKETAGEKFTFAELEEAETDMHKLDTWLGKIVARDFVESSQKQTALDKLADCRKAYEAFAMKVYGQQGIAPGDNTAE